MLYKIALVSVAGMSHIASMSRGQRRECKFPLPKASFALEADKNANMNPTSPGTHVSYQGSFGRHAYFQIKVRLIRFEDASRFPLQTEKLPFCVGLNIIGSKEF